MGQDHPCTRFEARHFPVSQSGRASVADTRAVLELLVLLATGLILFVGGIVLVDRHLMRMHRDRVAAEARLATERACALPANLSFDDYARDGLRSLQVMLAQAARQEHDPR
jgi:hypothetical protein